MTKRNVAPEYSSISGRKLSGGNDGYKTKRFDEIIKEVRYSIYVNYIVRSYICYSTVLD